MSYQSEFSGEQMENVFHKVMNMVTGTVNITASIDGYGYGFVYDAPCESNVTKIFAAVRGIDTAIRGIATVLPQYASDTGTIMFQLYGDGIKGGFRYAVDYMIME